MKDEKRIIQKDEGELWLRNYKSVIAACSFILHPSSFIP